MPFADKDPLFKELEQEAREHCMPVELREAYEYERMNRYIYESQMADRFLKGKAEGKAEGKLETARKLISEEGWSVEKTASFLGLSPEEITQN